VEKLRRVECVFLFDPLVRYRFRFHFLRSRSLLSFAISKQSSSHRIKLPEFTLDPEIVVFVAFINCTSIKNTLLGKNSKSGKTGSFSLETTTRRAIDWILLLFLFLLRLGLGLGWFFSSSHQAIRANERTERMARIAILFDPGTSKKPGSLAGC
jgi:hypothetical protein